MGRSLTAVPFFTDDIIIHPHTSSRADFLRPISIREFANGQPVYLYRVEETGEYNCRRGAFPCVTFIEGPEVLS